MFNYFSTIGHNIMDPTWCTLTHQGLSEVPRAQQEAPWFGRFQHEKQNKQSSFIDKY
jgi:hypothetical protein